MDGPHFPDANEPARIIGQQHMDTLFSTGNCPPLSRSSLWASPSQETIQKTMRRRIRRCRLLVRAARSLRPHRHHHESHRSRHHHDLHYG